MKCPHILHSIHTWFQDMHHIAANKIWSPISYKFYCSTDCVDAADISMSTKFWYFTGLSFLRQ